MRIIGLDIHRVFAEAVALEGGNLRRFGRIGMTRDHLEAFAATLSPTDHVVMEATGNAAAVADMLTPHVARIAVANPLQVHLIAKAKIKIDAIDAGVLMIHLGVQRALGQRLLQVVEEAIRIEGRLRIGTGQKLVENGIRNLRVFASRHLGAPLIPLCPTPHGIPDSPRRRPGLEAALAALWPDAPVQRCSVHKHRNLLAHAPRQLHDELTEDYRDMIYAETRVEIEQRRKAFLGKWRLKCKTVADSLEEAKDRLFSFPRLDPSQWKSARTPNAIERA